MTKRKPQKPVPRVLVVPVQPVPFDPARAQQAQERYLDHVNPYTKRPYREDAP